MEPEVLRKVVVEGSRHIAGLPRLVISPLQRQVSAAMADFWQDAPPGLLEKLDTYMSRHQGAPMPVDGGDAIRQACEQAAMSMRDRASRIALQHGVVPCGWVARDISAAIDALPLLAVGG